MSYQVFQEELKRMRLSSWQVKSMNCNEVTCHWNSNHFKGIFFNGFLFLLDCDKHKETEQSSVDDVYIVCPRQKT